MIQTLISVPDQAEYQSELVVQPAANAAINTVQQQMLDILQAMQSTQTANANSGGNNGGNHGGNNANGGGRNGGNNRGNIGDNNNPRRQLNRRRLDDAMFERQDKLTYFHTHGGSNHNSGNYNRRAPVHKNAAIFRNRMDGSNAFCLSGNVE